MNSYVQDIQHAVDYIEAHLTESLEIEQIAATAHISAFHFQRIFHVLCGFTVGEYIRSRRLSLAAQELAASDIKIIDAALKYGYDAPDSFTRAFTRFHGISPSQARLPGASLRAFAPVHIVLTLKGGTTMEYRITEKPSLDASAASVRIPVIRKFQGSGWNTCKAAAPSEASTAYALTLTANSLTT